MEESRAKSESVGQCFIDLIEMDLQVASDERRFARQGKRLHPVGDLRALEDSSWAENKDFMMDLLEALADIEHEPARFALVAVLRGHTRAKAREMFGLSQHAFEEAWAAVAARLRPYDAK